MFDPVGNASWSCDGIHRRDLLRVGSLSLGPLSLPQLLAHRAHASTDARKTSVIYIELAGGPTQFETYDPKPDATMEYRGPLGTVSTNVPGVIFSELMVEQAKVMDKLAIVRSVHHNNSSHGTSSHLVQTGYYKRGGKGGDNEFPSVGSVVAKLRGPNQPGIPGAS